MAGVRDRRIGRRFESRKYLCLLCFSVQLIAALMVTCCSLSGPAIDVVQRDLPSDHDAVHEVGVRERQHHREQRAHVARPALEIGNHAVCR